MISIRLLHVVGTPQLHEVGPDHRAVGRGTRAAGREERVRRSRGGWSTGQRYDDAMSAVFFDDLRLQPPDLSGRPFRHTATQTAAREPGA
jgi:hypothetical protein